MFWTVSLAATFLLMAPAGNRAPIALGARRSPTSIVLAQNDQPAVGTSENDNDSDNGNDSSDSADDNQNDDNQNDGNQGDAQGAAGESPSIPPTVLGGPDNDERDAQPAPQVNPFQQPANPNQ
jgi:hypothetical protein